MTLDLINNLWILFCGLLVFIMAISVGFLEIGELSERFDNALLKTTLITGSSLIFMAFVGFNIAFAPSIGGVIGNPLNNGLFLGMFSSNSGMLSGIYWLTGSAYSNTFLATGTFFFFEAACASVTLALVSVVVLRKVKLMAFIIYSAVYFMIIWTIPVSWIWNPSGWLYSLGVRDFAGGLLVHGAAAIAALGIMTQVWREEKKKGLTESIQVPINLNRGWLTLSILLLWIGWFGFNPGTELGLNYSAITIVLTTFISGSAGLLSTMFFKYLETRENPGMLYAVNGTLMGLVVITPLAGFVSVGSALILGVIAGPLFIVGEKILSKARWFTDPVGVLSVHGVGGLFGILMIGFFSQNAFASAAGYPSVPNGLFFGGGFAALHQLGLEVFGIIVVGIFVFVVSFIVSALLSKGMHGILAEESITEKEELATTTAQTPQ
ncbi:MAG: ammonium transporter [Thermoplasmataceae archaeon]